MSNEAEQQISDFRFLIKNRRFDAETLRILESVLTSRDLKSLLEVRSSLREIMRSESLLVMREVSDKSVEQKLMVLEFFVRAFALVGDVESCMALRYEALVLRELKSASSAWLQVSHKEWITFAEQSLDNGYFSISRKACEYALLSIERKDVGDCKANDFSENTKVIGKIKRLQDAVVSLCASHSVQAQATEYIKRRTTEKKKEESSVRKETQCLSSTLFRNGIKKKNVRKLHEYRRLKQTNHLSDAAQFRGVASSSSSFQCSNYILPNLSVNHNRCVEKMAQHGLSEQGFTLYIKA